jgi:hypothetical protein
MAFCRECGNGVSSDARECQQCGKPTGVDLGKKSFGRWLADNLAALIAAGTLLLGVIQYSRAQTWKRQEFLAQQMKDFFAIPAVPVVEQMLDWNSRYYHLSTDRRDSVLINDSILQGALSVHICRQEGFTSLEVKVRDHFDVYFNALGRFETLIRSGLVKTQNLDSYVGYYLRILGDSASGVKPPAFVKGMWRYLEFYRLEDVQKLLIRSGYSVDTVPIKDCPSTQASALP